MTKLAVNYSPEAVDLLGRGRIDVDLLKVPDWPDAVAEALALGPVYVHFSHASGHARSADVDVDRMAALRERTATPYVNTHLKAQPGDEGRADVLARTVRDVERLVGRFGAGAVVAENVPAWGDGPRAGADPAFIRRVLDETGCGLLLDVAHARIAARTLGIGVRDYLGRLPGERLRELHVTGIGLHEGRLEDHLPMQEDDWAATEWVFDRIAGGDWARPGIVALEYGGIGAVMRWRSEAAVLAREVPRLHALMRRLVPLAPTG